MLKLVGPAPGAHRRPAKRGKTAARVGALTRNVDRAEAVGNAVQRIVATGRREIIDVHGRRQRASTEARCRDNRTPRPPDAGRDCVPDGELVQQLAEIHHRLLFLSTSVELEMDRLEMVRQQIDRLIGAPANEHM
jgi:hypothetical protein